ncbi:hypothetical protein BGZ95_005127 [Linnemannia exigua]|uniref:Uncharacterized protein n=1 Tax=Linnemannia exigua TaxID=604196 RepID=A0AAD4DIN8_9FUNG|nr:hypothetical protein BGZ95_005127 [Linnemannia exigua]
MFAVRTIRAPLARVTLRAAPVARFSALSVRFGGHHEVKVNQGPGAAPGTTPTDLNQSTGVPGETHEIQWLLIDQTHEFDRCDQCGNVYKWTAYEADENFPIPGDKGHHH